MKGNTVLLIIASLLLICTLSISYKNSQQIQELRQENSIMLERIDSLINLAYVHPKSTNTQVPDSLSEAVQELAYEAADTGKGLLELFRYIFNIKSDENNGSASEKEVSAPKITVKSKYRVEDRYVDSYIKQPEIIGDETGQVELNIRIQFSGQVTSVKLKNAIGITNEEVIEACKKAALRTKFNLNVHQNEPQPGTITYFFVEE
jgi:hypothetical protein